MEWFREILQTFGLEYFNKYYGIYKGFVEVNDDPDLLCRLKLRVPAVYGEKAYDEWAYSKGMYAGKNYGLFNIPEVGDAVWVMFEGGDCRHPVWEHGWFGNGDKIDTASIKKHIFQTPEGIRFELDDENNTITIQLKNSFKVKITENGIDVGDDDLHPATLADKLAILINDFITDLGLIQGVVTTGQGIVCSFNNTAANWSQLVTKYATEVEKFKSTSVNVNG